MHRYQQQHQLSGSGLMIGLLQLASIRLGFRVLAMCLDVHAMRLVGVGRVVHCLRGVLLLNHGGITRQNACCW